MKPGCKRRGRANKHYSEGESDFERAVQFARSAPGITTALIGMSRLEHVRANLPLAAIPPANREQILRIFQQTQ